MKGSPGDFPGGPVVEIQPSGSGDSGSIPDQGTKIPHAVQPIKKKKFLKERGSPEIVSPSRLS